MSRAPVSVSTDPTVLPLESRRLLQACAGISALAHTALSEGTAAAAPFLGFAQKARIRTLSTRFDGGRGNEAVVVHAAPTSGAVAPGGGLSAEDVERIVGQRVDAAVRQALQASGAEQLRTVAEGLERRIEISGTEHEARIMDYVKRQLDDALEMLDSMIDERLREASATRVKEQEAEQIEKAAVREEIDRRVNDAREALLKDIDEVRTVDVGFNIDNFAADMAAAMAGQDDGSSAVDELIVGDQEEEVAAEAAAEEDSQESMEAEAPLKPVDEPVREIEIDTLEDLDIDVSSSAIELGPVPSQDDISFEDQPGAEQIGPPTGDDVPTDNSPAVDIGGSTFGAGAGGFGAPVAIAEDMEELNLGDAGGDIVELDLDVSDVVDENDDEPGVTAAAVSVSDRQPDDDASIDEMDEDAIEIDMDGGEDGGDGRRVEVDLALSGHGDHPEIEVALDDGTEGSDEVVARYLQRAAEMRLRKQTAAAMELYNKVLDMDPRNYEAHIGRGAVYLEGRDFKRAADEFTLAEEIDPQRPASALGLAEVHFYRKQFNKAIRHYSQCLQLDDRLAQAYCNRGLSYYYQKNYKKAFLDLMRAYELDPELPNIRKYLKLVKNKVKAETEGGAVEPIGE